MVDEEVGTLALHQSSTGWIPYLIEFVGSLLCSDRFFNGYCGFSISPKPKFTTGHLWPQTQKTGVRTDPRKRDTHSLGGQKCEVRTPFLKVPYPIFLSCKWAFARHLLSRLFENLSFAGLKCTCRRSLVIPIHRTNHACCDNRYCKTTRGFR